MKPKPVFKSRQSFHNYLLSGKKVRYNNIVYKYTKGVLLVYCRLNLSWLKSNFTLLEFSNLWYHSSNLQKVKNNNHLNQLIMNNEIW